MSAIGRPRLTLPLRLRRPGQPPPRLPRAAALTETTFEWKGLGFQLAEYLQARDFVAVQGIVVLMAVIVAVTNFLVDIIAALIDPRVRY